MTPAARVAGEDGRHPGWLVLADGEAFEGELAGALEPGAIATGELVFNTAMCGYQEVVTDPSYAGQVVAFTSTHIGNYGTNATDDEAARPWVRGVVVRDLTAAPSNWRSTEGFEDFLRRHQVPAMTGIDTRRLTRHLRDHGAMGCAFGSAEEGALAKAARTAPLTDGLDLVSTVTTSERYTREGVGFGAPGGFRVAVYDFEVKETMLRQLSALGSVTVVPADTAADEVLALDPDGVLLSNGPGDPAPLSAQVTAIADLIGRVPLFGICLGHQLLAQALGGSTYKLAFGHHGANHPVADLSSGRVEITSQNHNYAVAAGSIPEAEVSHLNLNDQVVEGIRCTRPKMTAPAFSVQYHPEAGPGPHDARAFFDRFAAAMAGHRGG